MKWVNDKSGLFPRRPHYLPGEMDSDCEQIIQQFLVGRYGRVEYPVSTADLTVLLETRVDDLDLYGDTSVDGDDVEGVTYFVRGKKPRVKISGELSAPYLENRLRTTLTHEFGHVHFHDFMFQVDSSTGSLFEVKQPPAKHSCNRESMIGARDTNWMEWQAGYACGSLLMPKGALQAKIRDVASGASKLQFEIDSEEGRKLMTGISAAFQVSGDAARVRMSQLGYLIARAKAKNNLF
jgi:hypothetical protein